MNAHELQKLLKVAGMMGSSHDGEAVAALRLVQGILARHTLSLVDILEKGLAEQQQKIGESADVWSTVDRGKRREPHKWGGSPRFQTWDGIRADHLLMALKRMPDKLTAWEREFIDSVAGQNRDRKGLTEKQWRAILGVAQKCRLYRPPAA